MPARCLHLLPFSAPSGARSWQLDELARTANLPNDAVYVASLAGDLSTLSLPCGCVNLANRPRDPLRWWRLFRWLKQEQPAEIRFWFVPGPWLRRLCRYSAPRSRWQVLFRSPSELPRASDRSWSALDTAWYDNPLLLERSSSTLAHAGHALLPWPSEKKVSGTSSPKGSQEVNHWALQDASSASRVETRKKVLSKLQLSAETILLLTTGPLVREKNQDQLFWSLDQLSCTRDDVRLLVIGDGPDRAWLEHQARLHHVEHRLIWLGTVDSPAEYLRAADLYVSADPRERVSRAMLEARAAGLPIIAHDTATNRQIVTSPTQGKLVDPTYLADYAGTIYRWLKEQHAHTT